MLCDSANRGHEQSILGKKLRLNVNNCRCQLKLWPQKRVAVIGGRFSIFKGVRLLFGLSVMPCEGVLTLRNV